MQRTLSAILFAVAFLIAEATALPAFPEQASNALNLVARDVQADNNIWTYANSQEDDPSS
ncbi:hypothetical protein EST38_g5653 [Candolleomyces aberdarensis]|uniref:Mating factor alpha n=1 Tax=Candolleomyces aberdarensis TaxID=2316362 RepID=A0A4Q2DJU2_9AGAR|nr:hypothetical protein EST38_g5653 [Candolleomyces aberdarensis]